MLGFNFFRPLLLPCWSCNFSVGVGGVLWIALGLFEVFMKLFIVFWPALTCLFSDLSVSMIFTFLFPFASMSLSSLSVVIDCTALLWGWEFSAWLASSSSSCSVRFSSSTLSCALMFGSGTVYHSMTLLIAWPTHPITCALTHEVFWL